jgi:KaiC/GvpD/RAD55 family RecA-like ATPase
MAITRQITLARDFAEEAEKLKANFGRTELFSTGAPGLDEYLSGGYGRKDGYEIVVLFGPTKIGKSTIALNLVADAIRKGQRVGIMNLEDDGPDVFLRLARIVGKAVTEEYILKGTTVHFMAPDAAQKAWKLSELIDLIEDWFTVRELDVILLDHIQFAFENADSVKGENEYSAQRTFMRQLNGLMRRLKKTIILVSHINKNASAKGTNQIVGSGGIAAAGTKLLEVSKADGVLSIQEHGSRFTYTPDEPHHIMLDTLRLKDWDGK